MTYSKVVMILNVSINILGITVGKVQSFGNYINELNQHGFGEG